MVMENIKLNGKMIKQEKQKYYYQNSRQKNCTFIGLRVEEKQAYDALVAQSGAHFIDRQINIPGMNAIVRTQK